MTTQVTRLPNIFISHAGPDAAFAQWVADGLAKVGLQPRLDQAEIRAGDNIITWMNSAVGESDYVLVLLSPVSVKRHWVEVEWASALMKEADLRRTFLIPALLPGVDETDIPPLLRAKAFVDFRNDHEAAFLRLVSRLKDDQIVARDLGRLPAPAPKHMVDEIDTAFPADAERIEVIVHSNRFARSFRVRIPKTATPTYLLGMLRHTLKLKFSNVDNDLGVELSYTYYLRHNGEAITLNTSLESAGVRDGDRLELWIRVTWRDLIEDKELGEQVFFHLYRADLKHLTESIRSARNRAFSSAEIASIASQFFAHIDE